MPIDRNKLISFNEDIEFLEKMDYDLAYSIEELSDLILGEFLPLKLEILKNPIKPPAPKK